MRQVDVGHEPIASVEGPGAGAISSGRAMAVSLVLILLLLSNFQSLFGQEGQRVVMGLKFQGNKSINAAVLSAGISTTPSGWFRRAFPFKYLGLGEKRYFNETEFLKDVLRVQAIYKLSGFYEVKVDTVVQRDPETVKVTFKITEGNPVIVTDMAVTGLDSVRNRSSVDGRLPLQEGHPFNRFQMSASSDSIVKRLRNRGYPAASILRSFQSDSITREAKVELNVTTGPLSRVGSIRVEGTSPIDTSFVRKMIPARPGRLFSQDELFISQRNLYRTELFQFSSVGIDSTVYKQTDSMIPLLARVREGRLHRARWLLGYGTTDCFRGSAAWRARNFSGGGRILDLSGRLSKVGVAGALDANLQDSFLCGQLKKDSIGSDKLNYNLTAALDQPGFFGPLNTLTYSVFAERRSEFKIYLRDEIGSSIQLRREGLRRVPLTLTYKLSYGKTEASGATFCAFFSACTQQDIGLLSKSQFLGTLTAGIAVPRANSLTDPTRGYVLSAEGTLSSRLLGSSSTQEFVKLVGDAAWYRELDKDIVLSWRLRFGTIFAPQISVASQSVSFIPPDERFYAGGPNDVRGYQRNELGPVVYVVETDSTDPTFILDQINKGKLAVRFSATGGNTLAVGNVELRLPSPIFAQRMRLALFVDGGSVWERGQGSLAPPTVRITPGFGFRIATPLGPARLDIAYNGYDRPPGALYRSSLQTGALDLISPNFTSGTRSNITFQFAIGQPF
ncbi:MAG: BamA/TamA family outer membrane protein [Gemmatimonadota bacterium]